MKRSVHTLLVMGLVVLGGVGWPASAPGQGVSASTASTGPEAEVLALRERAAAFWAARVAGDIETQYQFLEPRWKGRMTAKEYGSDVTGGTYLAYQVEGATVNGFFGTVKVRVLFRMIVPSSRGPIRRNPQANVVEEGWIRIGGVWYKTLGDSGQAPTPPSEP